MSNTTSFKLSRSSIFAVLIFALIATGILLRTSFANSPSVVVEPIAIHGDTAQLIQSADASDGSYLQFLQTTRGNRDAFPSPGSNTQILPVSYWTNKFSTSGYNSYCNPRSNTDDSWQYYGHAYCTDAFTSMYRATRDTQYLDEALRHVSTIISHAKPSKSLGGQFSDEYLGWLGDTHPVATLNNKEQQLYEIYQWRYVSTLLRVVKSDPDLMSQEKYRDQFNSIFAFSEKNIFDKWYSRGPNSYVYRVTPHISAHMALLATNFSQLTTDPARKARYDEVVHKINYDMPNTANSLKTHYEPHQSIPGAYRWSWSLDILNPKGDNVQDVSHGNAEIAYMVEAEGLGRDWSKQDLQPFVTTLKRAIIKDAKSDSCSFYVDGTDTRTCWIYDGFLKLGRYDQDLQKTFEEMKSQHSHAFVAHAALNARFLGAPN